jgi:hypothetical protein
LHSPRNPHFHASRVNQGAIDVKPTFVMAAPSLAVEQSDQKKIPCDAPKLSERSSDTLRVKQEGRAIRYDAIVVSRSAPPSKARKTCDARMWAVIKVFAWFRRERRKTSPMISPRVTTVCFRIREYSF